MDPSDRRRVGWAGLLLACAALLPGCGDGGSGGPGGDTCSTGPVVRAGLPGASGELLALSYDVTGWPAAWTGRAPLDDMPLIGARLNDYDLVLLQESWLTPDPNPFEPGVRTYHEILHEASDHFFRAPAAEAPNGDDASRPSALLADGLVRVGDAPFGPVVRERWPDCHGDDCLALQGFSVARHRLAEDVYVDVYDVRMEAGDAPEDAAIRADAIDGLVDHLASRGDCMAVLLAGNLELDTASDPGEAALYEDLLAGAGLTDLCETLACPEPGSRHKWAFRSGTVVAIEPLAWSRPRDDFENASGEPLSDHDPVAARFEWSLSPTPAPP